MLDGDVHMRPNYWFTLIKNEKDWMAFGSRKVDQVTVEAHGDYFRGALDTWDFDRSYIPDTRTFEFHGTSHTLTYVTGSTPLAAISALLDNFREEENKEIEEDRERKHQLELSEKRAKKRIKKMKKTGRFDDINSDYYDD